MVETGFAALTIPAGRESTAGFDSHSEGWTEMVDNLRAYAEK